MLRLVRLSARQLVSGFGSSGGVQAGQSPVGRALHAWQAGVRPALGAPSLLARGALRRPPASFAASFSSKMGQGPSALDQLKFKEMGLLSWLIVDLGINWVGWAVSAALKTDKFYDMLGTASFLTLSLGSMAAARLPHARKYVASAMVALWALRLGAFLVVRVHKVGHDSRFDEAKQQPFKFWIFWTMQAAWVFITLSPVLLLNTASAGGPMRIVWSDGVGLGIFLIGLIIEATADAQKFSFKMDPANKGRFIDTGLWSVSRFPNYFGEMTLWWGMYIFCTSGLQGAQFATVASPLFVAALLFFVSGIPLQEAQAKRRWGGEPEYDEYRQRTNLLLPIPKWLLPWGGCAGACGPAGPKTQ